MSTRLRYEARSKRRPGYCNKILGAFLEKMQI